jgi:DNA-binding response OmpR family regulator
MPEAKKILLVDDEPDTLNITSSRLKSAGYIVLTAANGKQALLAAVVHKPDLILLDLGLPDMEGSAVCRSLRASDQTNAIPIIAVTARYSAEVPDGKRALPIEGYLVKPFEPAALLDIVSTVLSKE